MRVISQQPLKEFWERHPDSKEWLRTWYRVASENSWRHLLDVREHYSSAEVVRGVEKLTVFNVCGNKYRMVVRIRYDWQLINVRCVLTHEQYDAGSWRD